MSRHEAMNSGGWARCLYIVAVHPPCTLSAARHQLHGGGDDALSQRGGGGEDAAALCGVRAAAEAHAAARAPVRAARAGLGC
jgi:hypothetical protein